MTTENTNTKDIRNLSFDDINNFVISNKLKKFRAKQIYSWLWKKKVSSFDEMTDLSNDLRALLKKEFRFDVIKPAFDQKSKDGTIKTAFRLLDNEIVEGVLIPSKERTTACLSSQVGCSLSCKFCATAMLKYKRNLTASEIFDQASYISKLSKEHHDRDLSSYVLMGMGEPLFNYNNVIEFINLLTAPDLGGVSPKRITISTAGVVKKIRQLGDDNIKTNLAISLHTANNEKRSKLMSINRSNPIEDLIKAIVYFHKKTQTRVTFEYLLLNKFNDSIKDAEELAIFCKNFPCKINLIEYNHFDKSNFKQSDKYNAIKFLDFIKSKNIIVNLRRNKGSDISAACGQLANIKS